MMDPRYRGFSAKEIPSVTSSGQATIKVIAGQVNGTTGPVRDIVTDPEYLDVAVPAHSEFTHATTAGHTVLAYVFEGKGLFCKEKIPFSFEVEGANYFDIRRGPFIDDGALILFGDGERDLRIDGK